MSKISDLSWKKVNLLVKFRVICLSEYNKGLSSRCPSVQVGALSALSSTYYSVIGTSGGQVKRILLDQTKRFPNNLLLIFNIWQVPFWLFLGGYCYLRSLPASNKMLKIAGGYENIDADKCDVRQSILRRHGWLDEALKCISWGVSKVPPKHCLALLLIGRTDIFIRKKLVKDNLEEVVSWLDRAVSLAEEVQDTEPQQASRIFRHCDKFYKKIGKKKDFLREKAKKLAEKSGAKDQLLKN